MKLQVAFDDVSIEQCLSILETSADDIDIIEVGTLFIIRYGLEPVRIIRKLYPKKTILADPKIMDAPALIAGACFDAGTDIVTVMSAASEAIVKKTVAEAHSRHGKVFVDLLEVNDPAKMVSFYDSLGADIICVHASKNADLPPFDALREALLCPHSAEIAIAGGISTSTIKEAAACGPDIVIVGSGVYRADDPAAVIRLLKEAMV